MKLRESGTNIYLSVMFLLSGRFERSLNAMQCKMVCMGVGALVFRQMAIPCRFFFLSVIVLLDTRASLFSWTYLAEG